MAKVKKEGLKKLKKKGGTGLKKKTKAVKNAAKILSDVPAEKCFWANNGWIIKNLKELPIALENMSDETFVYHVNKGKNDFAKWIDDVIGDKELAKGIGKIGKKNTMIVRIEKGIKALKR
jgi:hypothetical protein